MPVVPTIGVPFVAARLDNGDGTTITATVTVTDAQQRFTLSVNNGSVRASRVVWFDPQPVEATIPAGVTAIPVGNRRWNTVTVSVASA